jgi:hypothetical protein
MDDFGGDLWGEDDIDEALLIEASQQVEAETVKVNRTKIALAKILPNIKNNTSFLHY